MRLVKKLQNQNTQTNILIILTMSKETNLFEIGDFDEMTRPVQIPPAVDKIGLHQSEPHPFELYRRCMVRWLEMICKY